MTVYKRKDNGMEQEEYSYSFTIDKKRYRGTCKGCTSKSKALEYEKIQRDGIIEAIKVNSPSEALRAIIIQKTDIEPEKVNNIIQRAVSEINSITSTTLADAYEVYLQKPAARHPCEKRLSMNRSYFKDFVMFIQTQYPSIALLKEVLKSHAEAYITQLRTHGPFIAERTYQRTGGKSRKRTKTYLYTPKIKALAGTTINERHTVIRSVFETLAEDEGIVHNPFNIPKLKKDKRSRDIFSSDELDTIIREATIPILKPLFMIGLYTGLSLKDICFLRWCDIQNGFIMTDRFKTGAHLEIPILPAVQEVLDYCKKTFNDAEWVNPELQKAYSICPSSVTDKVKVFLEGLGIQTTFKNKAGRMQSIKGIHALRHTFAYMAGKAGIPIAIVQSILGHMTPEMTALYQRHATREDKINQLAKLNNLLSQPQTEKLQ